LLAQRGLGDMQHIGGLGQAADVDDFDEILQTPDIHHIIPLLSPACRTSA
jgi:hypothetical protein